MKEYTQPEKLGQQIIEKCLDSHKVTNSLLISIDILSRLNNIGLEISQPNPDAAEGAGLEKLARTIAQADFIWELGESSVMACSPELAGKQFDQAYDADKKQKYLHIAQVVSATPATPQPAPDAMREALKLIEQTCHVRAATIARDALRAAPVPSPDGAGEHGIQCALCGETLHDSETCDDAECPIGGSSTVHPSATGAAEPVSDERALKLAHQICTGKLSAVQGAVEIMQYATDGVLQIQAATPPVRGDRSIDLDAGQPFENFISDPLFEKIPDEEILTAGSALTRSYITYGELRTLCKAISLLPNRKTFYSILKKFIPQETIDEAWQELKEAGWFRD